MSRVNLYDETTYDEKSPTGTNRDSPGDGAGQPGQSLIRDCPGPVGGCPAFRLSRSEPNVIRNRTMDRDEETRLIHLAQAGDRDAAGELYLAVRDLLALVAVRVADTFGEDREEAIAYAAVFFLESLEKFDPELGVPLANYAATGVRRRLTSMWRTETAYAARNVQQLSVVAEKDLDDVSVAPDEPTEKTEQVDLAQGALERLRAADPEQARLVERHVMDGVPLKDLAHTEFAVTPQALSMRLRRAVEELQNIIRLLLTIWVLN